MSGGRWQSRIGWIMALVFVVAAVVGAISRPLDNVALGVLLAPVVGFLLVAVYVLAVFLPYFLIAQRFRCPACGSRLACVVVILFRPPLLSLHRCPGCRAQLRRFPVGGWQDAGGVEYERWFPPTQVPPGGVPPDASAS